MQLVLATTAWLREPRKERRDDSFPALIRGMHDRSNADWWDERVTVDASLLARLCTLAGHADRNKYRYADEPEAGLVSKCPRRIEEESEH